MSKAQPSDNWGGTRPGAGRKGPRKYPKLDEETAQSLYTLTKYRRALLGKPELEPEEVIHWLVEMEWERIQSALETANAEEMKEPYIL